MFRYAAFPVPDFLAATVPVWRGTWGVSERRARAAYSWTLDRNMACWFALRSADLEVTKPLVLAAEVQREEIVLYTDERREAEAVLMRPPAARVDGTPDEWQRWYEAVKAARRAEQRRLLQKR